MRPVEIERSKTPRRRPYKTEPSLFQQNSVENIISFNLRRVNENQTVWLMFCPKTDKILREKKKQKFKNQIKMLVIDSQCEMFMKLKEVRNCLYSEYEP